jgi:hypothetical protein
VSARAHALLCVSDLLGLAILGRFVARFGALLVVDGPRRKGDGTEQQHAFPSFFELPDRHLGVIWLDGRDTQPTDALPEGGPMALRYASFDSQWKRTAEGVIDERACECCATATAMTSEGVLVGFRDRSDKEIRDIAVSRFENGGWTKAQPVHNDNWEVYACPVNGPALSARGRQAGALRQATPRVEHRRRRDRRREDDIVARHR